jgi:hypothetical protein
VAEEIKLPIVAQLRSGFDNADGGEFGGVLLTMNEAADVIEELYACLESLERNGHTQQTWRNVKAIMAKARGERT